MKVKADMTEVDAAAKRWARRERSISADSAAAIKAHEADFIADAVAETPIASGTLAGGWSTDADPKGTALVNRSRYAGFVLGGELASKVRARVAARAPTLQPEIVRRQTHGGS